MKIVSGVSEIRGALKGHTSIGFVPTMGALHEGHISLVKKSNDENEITVASIFLNPTQFNNPEDLAKYPVSTEQDIQLLKDANCDILWMPQYDDLYSDQYRYQVHENQFSKELCGTHRPGHFDGVLTVVMKLLNIVRPRKAYFGEKDFQQLQLIRDMVQSFFMDVEIVNGPTVRDEFGLALSSRNRRLSKNGIEKARSFNQVLSQASDVQAAREELLRLGFEVDYIEEHFNRRFGAVNLENIRLIDNVEI
ncbi:MAG: pantoate--beta-alanine ligase [Bdellovibrionales bacterium]|nr:pantoate--beta-alanine ligase [Bdellovibrionales bacterium]